MIICKKIREEFQLSKFGFDGIDRDVMYDSFVSILIRKYEFK